MINHIISNIQAQKYAANIYPGWVSVSDIQKELGYLPKKDIEQCVLDGKIKAVNAMCGVCYCIESEPLLFNEVKRLILKRR